MFEWKLMEKHAACQCGGFIVFDQPNAPSIPAPAHGISHTDTHMVFPCLFV